MVPRGGTKTKPGEARNTKQKKNSTNRKRAPSHAQWGEEAAPVVRNLLFFFHLQGALNHKDPPGSEKLVERFVVWKRKKKKKFLRKLLKWAAREQPKKNWRTPLLIEVSEEVSEKEEKVPQKTPQEDRFSEKGKKATTKKKDQKNILGS